MLFFHKIIKSMNVDDLFFLFLNHEYYKSLTAKEVEKK